MKFMMNRNRTIASTCGLSIEFKKGELHLVPPAMYAEVIAAGGVPEHELEEAEQPVAGAKPASLEERKAQMMEAFKRIVLRADRDEFTAGGTPHGAVLSREVGWTIVTKERDAAWVEFQNKSDDE